MITFNPGPSQLSVATKNDIKKSFDQNICSISHRSAPFTDMSQKADEHMRKYFGIPDNYTILWGASATEMMELVINSSVEKNSFHFTNGSFSDRFVKISRLAGRNGIGNSGTWGTANDYLMDIPSDVELITITQNETSTGFQVPMDTITAVRQKNPDPLLVIDATSIMGIEPVDISAADGWLFSVQKCFGLPSGLGVLVINNRLIERSEKISRPYNNLMSLSSRVAKMQKNYQTVQTPNSLGIFLLGEQLERWNNAGGMTTMAAQTNKKFRLLKDFIDASDSYSFFVEEQKNYSKSVFCIRASAKQLEIINSRALTNNIVLGGGYGNLKTECFRVANFPAHSLGDFERLIDRVL